MIKKYLKRHNLLKLVLFYILLYVSTYSISLPFKQHFVYLKSNEVNMRVGPSKNHKIKWVIKSYREPLKAVEKFDDWIKVIDIDGEEGWIKSSFTSTKIFGGIVIGKEFVFLYNKANVYSPKIAKIQQNARVKVIKCNEHEWCNVSVDDFKGWVEKKYLWGV